MADPKRLVILQTITDHLVADISLANGYQHELSAAQVIRGRNRIGTQTVNPAIGIVENLNPDTDARPSRADGTKQVNTWLLLVQGWVDDDETHPTDPAYRLCADVQQSLAKLIPGRIAGLVLKISLEPPVVRPPDEVSSHAYFYFRLRLELLDDASDPYRLT